MSSPKALRVPPTEVQRALRLLARAGLADRTRRVRRESPEQSLVPALDTPALADVARELGAPIVPDDTPRAPRDVPPIEHVLARLGAHVPRALVPDRWELFGDVLVLRLVPDAAPFEGDIARAFADVLRVKTVLQDTTGVSGELRQMQARLLLGTDPVATHVEGGITYRWDASRIMFSSGNVHERMRMGTLDARGETVVDMFAGIGYLTLPLAARAGPERVLALEKNPESHRWLVENARLNGVEHVVEAWQGDNRDHPAHGIADRVLMGYFPGTARFLDRAMAFLKDAGGTLHYHDTAPAHLWRADMETALRAAGAARGFDVEVLQARVVKGQSPGIVHAVMDARVA